MPRWYLIGRLGRRSSTWAYFILGQLILAAWLLEGMPMPTSAAGAGALIGCIISSFGICAGFGWIASTLAWRICTKSQGAALTGFFLGAAGIFALVVMGNVRIERAKAETKPWQKPAAPKGDIFDQMVTSPQPSAQMPPIPEGYQLIGRSAPAQQQPAAPDPSSPSAGNVRPLDEPPGPDPAPATWPAMSKPLADIDLPAQVTKRLKSFKHQDGYDLAIEAEEPSGWNLSSITVEVTPVGDPANVGLPKTFLLTRYIPLDGDHGTAHFYVAGAFRLSSGQMRGQPVKVRIVGASGHRVL